MATKTKKHKYIRWFWRIPLAILATVEFLAVIHIIPYQPQFTSLGLLFTSAAVWIFLELAQSFLERRHASIRARWVILISVTSVYLDAFGDFFFLYARIPHYDAFLHFFASISATVLVWHLLEVGVSKRYSRRFLLTFTVCLVITFGTVYEISEYIEDFFTGSHRLGDGFDTANDLLLDSLGALMIVVLWWFKKKFKK